MYMNGTVPHIVQYQGSKRILAPQILPYMPHRFERLIEPFAGMAAITIATAKAGRAGHYVVNDLNKPLVDVQENEQTTFKEDGKPQSDSEALESILNEE